jgi:hypothetical protein
MQVFVVDPLTLPFYSTFLFPKSNLISLSTQHLFSNQYWFPITNCHHRQLILCSLVLEACLFFTAFLSYFFQVFAWPGQLFQILSKSSSPV